MAEFHTMPRDPQVAKLMEPTPSFAQTLDDARRFPPTRAPIDHAERALRVQAMQFAVMAFSHLPSDKDGAEHDRLAILADEILTFLKGGDAPVDEAKTEA